MTSGYCFINSLVNIASFEHDCVIKDQVIFGGDIDYVSELLLEASPARAATMGVPIAAR
jgi:hypothetical protein